MWFVKRGKSKDPRQAGTVGDRMVQLNLVIKVVSRSDILQELGERSEHVDRRLRPAIEEAVVVLGGTIQDETSFLSLIWHDIESSRILTPSGKPIALRDVAERMIAQGHTFDTLCSSNDWFRGCLCIHERFDHAKLGWVVVTNERNGIYERTPYGSLCIYDGCHKSLVYAYRLLAGTSEYKPVEVLWLLTQKGMVDLPDS